MKAISLTVLFTIYADNGEMSSRPISTCHVDFHRVKGFPDRLTDRHQNIAYFSSQIGKCDIEERHDDLMMIELTNVTYAAKMSLNAQWSIMSCAQKH